MNHKGRLKRFALFVAASATERRTYVGSFHEKEQALTEVARLITGPGMRWYVVDNTDSKVVAEHNPPAPQPVREGDEQSA
jgi:hypothetical protein